MHLSTPLERLARQTIAKAIEVQQIAAPTFAEQPRARWVGEQLRNLTGTNECKVEIRGDSDDEPTNVLAFFPGMQQGAPLLVSAHTDTVFPAETDLSVTGGPDDERVCGAGIGDNSLAVAALLSLAEVLVHAQPLPRPIVLLANAGEEGRGDLCGINGALDLLASRNMTPAAAIVLEGLALGRVYHAGIGVKRYEVRVHGPGGHSWGEAGSPSAIHELAHLLSTLARISIAEDPRSSLNIGVVEGGRSVNTIADYARAELDLRSVTAGGLAELDGQVQEAISQWCPTGVTHEISLIGSRPAGGIATDHPLVAAALAAAREPARLHVGSTDANALYARGVPSVCVGITTGANAHRLTEYINTAPVGDGLAALGSLVESALGLIEEGGD